MRRGPLDRQRDPAQQQPRPHNAARRDHQEPQDRRAEQRRCDRAMGAADHEHDRVEPHERQHRPAAEAVRRLEIIVVPGPVARACHEHHHDDQARGDRRDRQVREVDAALPGREAIDQHRHEREVPDRPGQREPDMQPTEVRVLAERPAHSDRPGHRRARREPAEEVDHVLLAKDDRQRDVRVTDDRDRRERRPKVLPVPDPVRGQQRVCGEHDHDQPVVMHRPRALEQPPQPPGPRRQGRPVGTRQRPHIAVDDHLGEITRGRL